MGQTRSRLHDLKKWDEHREARDEELYKDSQLFKSVDDQAIYWSDAVNDDNTHADRDYSDKMVKSVQKFLEDHRYEI